MKSFLRRLDARLSAIALRVCPQKPALLAFVFHGLFRDTEESQSGLVDPFQPLLVTQFRTFVRHFIANQYRFLRPDDLLTGLDPHGRFAMITFDDGYANNLLALPVLHECGVPATVFVCSNHVVQGKSFWWDVLYRERRSRGVAVAQIAAEQTHLKSRTYHDIERHLRSEFGAAALCPKGETDRPLNPEELRDLAGDPLVTIGNHTADHAILTNLCDSDARQQIRHCQMQIAAFTGKAPTAIAYPNGDYDERVVAIARSEGLSLGLGVQAAKIQVPLSPGQGMVLPRCFIRPGTEIVNECLLSRTDVRPLAVLRDFLAKPGSDGEAPPP